MALYFTSVLNVEVNMAFANIGISCHVLLSAGKVNPGSHMRFVDTYLEDVSTVDITATVREFTCAIPVVGDHVVVWFLGANRYLSPFSICHSKFNLIVGHFSQFIDKNMAFVGINYPARLNFLQFS